MLVKIKRAYKTEIDPTAEQEQLFHKCIAASRIAFNWMLTRIQQIKQETDKHVPARIVKKEFNAIKDNECPGIRELPYTVIASAGENVDAGYNLFFKLAKKRKAKETPEGTFTKSKKFNPPKIKEEHPLGYGSFTLRGAISVTPTHIQLPSARNHPMGLVRLCEKNYLPTTGVKILAATVSYRLGKWYVSLQVEQDADIRPATGAPIGLDVGIKSLVVVSDGSTYENPKPLRTKKANKIAKLQRHMDRKMVKGSKSQQRMERKIAKLHRKAADIRAHNHHEVSAAITRRYSPDEERPSMIGMERLNIKGMMQNHRLAGALSDASLSELQRQITYKAEWGGTQVVQASQWFASSKKCSRCGNVKEKLSLSERVYHCEVCGLVIDRDLNASINIEHETSSLAIKSRPQDPVDSLNAGGDGITGKPSPEVSGSVPVCET